jgi:hypothetical protein
MADRQERSLFPKHRALRDVIAHPGARACGRRSRLARGVVSVGVAAGCQEVFQQIGPDAIPPELTCTPAFMTRP